MAHDTTSQPNSPDSQTSSFQQTSHTNILNQSLEDILTNNPQAQQMIMKSMGISEEKFQQMLGSAGQNNMMNMKIGDLFKEGIVQQAIQQYPSAGSGQSSNANGLVSAMVSELIQLGQQVQVTPEQMQQLQNGALSPQQLLQQSQPTQQKTSFLDKVRNWFK